MAWSGVSEGCFEGGNSADEVRKPMNGVGNLMDEVWNPMDAVRNPVDGVRNPKLEVRNPKLEVWNPVFGVPDPKLGVRNLKSASKWRSYEFAGSTGAAGELAPVRLKNTLRAATFSAAPGTEAPALYWV